MYDRAKFIETGVFDEQHVVIQLFSTENQSLKILRDSQLLKHRVLDELYRFSVDICTFYLNLLPGHCSDPNYQLCHNYTFVTLLSYFSF